MSDYRTSLLVQRQVPEFVREEHPLFIAFLEAYYEFLETNQGTKKTDLVSKSKDMRDLADVDMSIDDFESAFFNMYASLIPKDVVVDKSTLIKNVLPLYLSKGSEKSFKLLFRMMFGDEVTVSYPKNQVLKASDGKWLIEKYLRIDDEVYCQFTGNGTTKEFDLPNITGKTLKVELNGVTTTNYYVRPEIQKIYFNTAPSNGTKIKVTINNFDYTVVENRKAVGTISGATALIERSSSQILQNKIVHEFYVDNNSLFRTFNIGEIITVDIFNFNGDGLVTLYFKGLSSVIKIDVIDGGRDYKVNDPVYLNSPNAETQPTAVISKVFSGVVNKTIIHNGGSGFRSSGLIDAVGYTYDELVLSVAGVSEERANSVASYYFVPTELISDINLSTLLSASDWNFTYNIGGGSNLNSVIATTLRSGVYDSIGAISEVTIINSNVSISTPPLFDARPASINVGVSGLTPVGIDTYGSIGKLSIVSKGSGYSAGDELIFTNPRGKMSIGCGVEGEVSNVSTLGTILEVALLPPKITGTANVWSASNTRVQGHNTTFLTDLKVGDLIVINSSNTRTAKYETRQVINIASDTSLNVNTAFTGSFVTDTPIRKLGVMPVGGINYEMSKLPTVTIDTLTGTGGEVVVSGLLGMGEDIEGQGTKRPGEIEEISVINPGAGISVIPQIDLTKSGDGTATANITLSPTFDSLPGRWTSSDGILSSDRRIQGRNFYGDYSYLTTSQIEFSKYKKIFKDLLHPAGFRAYAEWEKKTNLDQQPITLSTVTAPKDIKTISGLVSIANDSITVTGVGTRFNVANSLGIISIGGYIAVNSDIRMINAIISNTSLTVSSPFTVTSSSEEMVVINTAYNAVATEVTLEEITTETEISLTVEL